MFTVGPDLLLCLSLTQTAFHSLLPSHQCPSSLYRHFWDIYPFFQISLETYFDESFWLMIFIVALINKEQFVEMIRQ